MGKATILMVEDEAGVLAANKEFLEGKGFLTCSATNIAEARKKLLDAPDMILLDVMLPDGMGWDFAKEIRCITNAPIIFLSSRDENESVIKGLMQGGDDYITKPYDMNVLYARIIPALRRTGLAMAGVIEAPPLYIDMLSGSVKLQEETIYLSQKEMQLLSCLALDIGRYISCDELYRRAWGGEPIGNYMGTVSVQMSRLRQKLKLTENGLFEIRATSDQKYILMKMVY